jgi:hypothetical protein
MVDWNNATGLQLAIIQEALLSAYPTPADFETFLLLRLNRSYAQLAGHGANYVNGMTQVLTQARAAGWVEEVIVAAQADRPNSPRVKKLNQLGTLTSAATPANRTLEDIIRKEAGFQDVIPWVRQLDRLTAQVCRIESPVNQGVGTGWLVAKDLVLTNAHVAARLISKAKRPSDYACRFDYATDATRTNTGVVYQLADPAVLASSPASPLELGTGDAAPTLDQLDFAVIQLTADAGNDPGPTGSPRGWIATRRGTPMPPDGSIVLVLQHPDGDPLKLDIGYVSGRNDNGARVKHNANTVGGSSGSPCFDVKLESIALHNSGDPLYDGVHGKPNENHAVPLDLILAKLEGRVPTFWQ